jgi:hypothetical protein
LLVENLWFIHSDRPNFELQVKDSIISHGCFLRDCSVEHSIVGIRSRLESGAVLKVGGPFFFLFKKEKKRQGLFSCSRSTGDLLILPIINLIINRIV